MIDYRLSTNCLSKCNQLKSLIMLNHCNNNDNDDGKVTKKKQYWLVKRDE